jgi:hypothetical protein
VTNALASASIARRPVTVVASRASSTSRDARASVAARRGRFLEDDARDVDERAGDARETREASEAYVGDIAACARADVGVAVAREARCAAARARKVHCVTSTSAVSGKWKKQTRDGRTRRSRDFVETRAANGATELRFGG